MRAAVLRGGRLEVRETPDPVPGPGELLVRTLSTAICASDIHYMDHPDPDDTSGHVRLGCRSRRGDGSRVRRRGRRARARLLGPVPRRHTSHEHPDARPRRRGRQVIGQHPDAPGSFGELFLVSELLARAVPDDADADAVAVTDAFAVGEGYVALSGIGPGQIPLVIGAGAIGLSAVAALASPGSIRSSSRTTTTSGSSSRGRFGAHITVNPSQRSAVRRLERDRGRALGRPRHRRSSSASVPPGLLQQIVEACPMGSRIYAAGGWYTGDALNITTRHEEAADDPVRWRARAATTGTARSTPSSRDDSTRARASAWSSGSTAFPTPSISHAAPRARRGSSSTPISSRASGRGDQLVVAPLGWLLRTPGAFRRGRRPASRTRATK